MESTYQVKCEKCGNVRHIQGPVTSTDRVCPDCHEVITESEIIEIKQDFLLE